jgi:hypothetical protein
MTGVETLHLVFWPGLFGFSALAVLVALCSLYLDVRGRVRVVTALAMALIVAFVLRLTTVTAYAWYYDSSYYCGSWIGWFDFLYC